MLKHRTFVGRTWVVNVQKHREQIRGQVEAFVNSEVGQENVVSISECVMTVGPLSVCVWYKDNSEKRPNTQ